MVHEAAYALMARRAGVSVRDLTLWALGGLTRMDRPATARTAFAVAVSEPLTSPLVGGVGLLGWLGSTNLLLGVFNGHPERRSARPGAAARSSV
ncbi:hypothetical protein ACFQ0G_43390 [Streptomyces chiangmaiensis]